MHLDHVIIILVQVFAAKALETECPDHSIVSVVKKYLVKEDPVKYYVGRFSNVWVREQYKDFSKASGSEYKQVDGNIQETAKFVDLKGEEQIASNEVLKKTAEVGVFELSGTYTSSEHYYGKTYVFYADENIIAYYGCLLKGSTWNMGIQVKSEKKNSLLPAAGDNDVKKSLKEAEKKVDNILNDFFKEKHFGFVEYDLNTLY